MASEDEPDLLKVFWDHFFKAETGTYEKSTWLDLFLAEFLVRVNEGADPKELINFCPVSGVVTLVGCELLCGLHRVTMSVSQLAGPLPPPSATSLARDSQADSEPQSEERTTSLFSRHNQQSFGEVLRQYLLSGVAWRCLALLRALGVQGLSCCRQLSSVLVWAFGELCSAAPRTAPPPRAAPQPASSQRPPIHQLFSPKIWSKQKPKVVGSPSSKVNSANSSERGSVTGRSRYSGHTKTDSSERAWRSPMKDLSSESGDSHDDLQVLNRSLTIKVSSPKDDFDYFNSPLRSSTDYGDTLYGDPYHTPRKPKPKADDYMNDKHREIINTEISSFQFILMVTDLLQELCKTESSLSGSEGSQISVQCINFSLRNLCSLQFGSVPSPAEWHDTDELSRIKVALTELLIVSLDKVLVHSDLCAKLINNGILPMLLRLLEDVVCKCSSKYQTKETQKRAKEIETPRETESENLLKFVFGVAYSITAFFHCLLMQCRSVEKLREFTDQFKLYGECLKGGLLKDCIELMIRIPGTDRDETVVLIKKLIESIGKLISGMKRVRSEVIHSAACPRARHKICRGRVAAGMHHHHDILGEAVTSMPMSSACCISVLYGTLTALVADEEIAAQAVLRHKILKVMSSCGVCCCFAPGVLMESIVRVVLTHHAVAAACLQLLESTVYGELGASVLIPKVTDQLPCSVCEPCADDRRETLKSVTKLCSHVGPVERKKPWSFLIHYNSLLQLDNHAGVLHATVAHLLRVTPKCRMEMKYELLFSVIYPTFIVAKHRYMIRSEETAYFLTTSCLNIFAGLLNTVSFAEQFIQKGGLSYVLELVSLPEYANQCCSILEIAIVVEIFKLIKENSELSYYRDVSSLASVQMLFKSLSDLTEKFYKIYRLKLPEEDFEELCDLSKEMEMLSMTESPNRKTSTPMDINSPCVLKEYVVEECIEDHLSVLKNVCTFWKSCAGLCVAAPLFRSHVGGARALVDSYALLKIALRQLCLPSCGESEARLLIRLVEALLTVQFAVSDVTMGRSKATSCRLVRGALRAPCAAALAADSGGGRGLRALCDALVRVAAAAPRDSHAMPRQAPVKVPPLACPPGCSSAEGSSGEEASGGSGASGPYASDHSDAPQARPDEGYEADVEIGNFDAISEKARIHPTSSPVSDNSFAGIVVGLGSQAAVAAHPELGVIVVDILVQIINKVMDAVSSAAGPDESTWSGAATGAGVARACAARLCAPHAPPAPLLKRLLAPQPARLLASREPRLKELQRSVLELFHALARRSLEAEELAAFFRLFLNDAPPLGALLGALQRLIAATPASAPAFALAFPAPARAREQAVPSPQGPGPGPVSPPGHQAGPSPQGPVAPPSHQAEALAQRLREAHTRSGVMSAWRAAACSAGLAATGWAAWLQGFAATAWIRNLPNDRTTTEDESTPEVPSSPAKETAATVLHVFSLGNDSLLFEMWLEVATGTIVFRVSRPEANSGCSEGRVEGALTANRWSHVALNVNERLHKRRIHVQATLFVNGYEFETVSLPLQGILSRKVTATNVLLGDLCADGCTGAYELSELRVLRAPLLTRHVALHLAAHAPAQACHVRCETPNYPSVLTPNVIDSNMDWDQVYDMGSGVLRELHGSALCTWRAHQPHALVAHLQPARPMPAVFGGRNTSGVATSGAPEAVRVRWAAVPDVRRHKGFYAALHALGGAPHLLYLFARVVELEASEEEQAAALRIVLRACRGDGRLYAALYGAPPLDMLHAALPPQRTHHVLQVILDEACSAPILIGGSGGSPLVVARNSAALLEPELLALLLRAWKVFDRYQELEWEVEGQTGTRRGSAWELALECCCSLLRESHARGRYNQRQAARPDLLLTLLRACKERFLNSDSGALGEAGSNSLVCLVRGLLGSPPLLHHLAMLTDFLLLMHQASDTFVTHSRANFYFLLTPETQEMSEFNNQKKKSSLRRKFKEKVIPTEEPEDNSSNVLPDLIQSHESDDRTDPESSMDSTKQMKGIINSQIKEYSKNTDNSATSESSEPSLGRRTTGAAATPEADADLTEYIVVDLDDVRHTTVDLYTGGIYQQSRLRAGAEPGWTACSGLLLLLRDTIAVLPDHQLAQALNGAVSAQSLIVLANHRSGAVRAAGVRALAALQRRAPPDLARALRQDYCYLHLANQISLYPPTWELAAACTALITKCDVPLEDQLDEDIWAEASEEWCARSPPLLALLPGAVWDVPLAHNITRVLRRLIDKSSLRVLSEVSMCEVIIRAIRAVGRLGDSLQEGKELLAEDLYQLLAHAGVHALKAHHGMQTLCDIHHMLTFVELTATTEEERVMSRDAQIELFLAQLEYLETRLGDAAPPSYAAYFTTVLTSAVSLGGGGEGRVERGELAARHLGALQRAAAFLLTHPPAAPLPSARHAALYERLVHTLLAAVNGANSPQSRPRWWSGGGAEWTSLLQELVWWGGAPAGGVRALQPALLRALYRAPPPALPPPDPPNSRKLAVYLLSMLQHQHLEAEHGAPAVELAILDWARGWAVSTQAALPERLPRDAPALEGARHLRQDARRWARARAPAQHHRARAVFSKESLCARLAESAMGITRQVVEAQNAERKGFMTHLRRMHAARSRAAARWHLLVASHTHERAVWHEPRGYPVSWQLDPTEGPGRVRVRLRRAHLRIPPKFLKPEQRYKAELAQRPPPLRGVIWRGAVERDGLAARLQPDEVVVHMARVTHVTVDRETGGELLLTDRAIHFVPDDPTSDESDRSGCGCGWEEEQGQCWPLSAVRSVVTRRWCLQERAVELFLASRAHLLAFSAEPERAAFLQHLPHKVEQDSLSEAMNQWRSGSITNWEYLMRLNGLGGRSYNDLMQYPVLPFVLAEYTAREIDLNDPATFRDFSKPMAIQRKAREQHYINTYNDLAMARREGCSPLVARQAHHYASLYSNSGGVLHYLVRVPPFTELFLNYQDNNFDMPDRTFHSLATTWRLITNDSPTDVKELIPELFYLPELFHNTEGLDLGVRQCGLGVDDVEVPPWAADARQFVLLQRQALEAAPATDALPHWIDLVFGYKQTGQAAIDAINVFPACTYYGFDPSALEDEVDRTAAAAMVRTYGQAPRQLLRAPHPLAALAPHAPPPRTPPTQLEACGGVRGVRWGRYCGSPQLPPPTVRARRPAAVAAVVSLPNTRLAAALPPCTALLALPDESSTHGSDSGSGKERSWGIVSWGHWDDVVRLRHARAPAPEPLLYVPPVDQITCVVSSTSSSQPLLVGFQSGRVEAWEVTLGTSGLRSRVARRSLHAHRAPISHMAACTRAALLVTASTDGYIVLWDLPKLTYIRTLPNRGMLPVSHVAISPTLCDVASVHDAPTTNTFHHDQDYDEEETEGEASSEEELSACERNAPGKYQSIIRVHTVNARFVGSVRVAERVTCACYSGAGEGVSVNALACGLAAGGWRLYSSWDLRRLPAPADDSPAAPAPPMTGLAYSWDSATLFGWFADGSALAWESEPTKPPPRIVPAHALL